MNPLQPKLVTAIAVLIVTGAGAACATTSDTIASNSMPRATTLAQSTPSTSAARSSTTGASPTPSTAMPPSSSTTSSSSPSTATPSDTNGTAATSAADASQQTEARKIFDQLDVNHDGNLSFDEFSRATFRAK